MNVNIIKCYNYIEEEEEQEANKQYIKLKTQEEWPTAGEATISLDLSLGLPLPLRRLHYATAGEGVASVAAAVCWGLRPLLHTSGGKSQTFHISACSTRGTPRAFCMFRKELAVTYPKNGSISILGSEDASICHIEIQKHAGNRATSLTHCDRTDTNAEVPFIMNSVKSFTDHAECGRLEVYLVGGFSDDR